MNPEGAVDCRTVAVADSRLEAGHVPGVIFTRIRIAPDGSVTLDAPAPADRIEVRVPVTLADGSIETRSAGVRALAFGPAPRCPDSKRRSPQKPLRHPLRKALRAARAVYSGGARSCPNLAVLNLAGAPALATDATSGGPAAYVLPGAQLGLVAMQGPFDLSNPKAFDPSRINERDEAAAASPVPSFTLVTSSDGRVTYVAGGLGTFLQADGSRAAPDPVFLLSSNPMGPRASVLRRTDTRRGALDVPPPVVSVPPGARPRSETWTAGFETPLPGGSGP